MPQRIPAPNASQQAVLDVFAQEQGSALVEAGPGTGKSDLLLRCLSTVDLEKTRVWLAAFSNQVARDLARKVPEHENLAVSTMHALGLLHLRRAIGHTHLWPQKYTHLAHLAATALGGAPEEQESTAVCLEALAMRAMLTLTDPTDPDALHQMALEHAVDLGAWEQAWPLVDTLIKEGRELAMQEGQIAYADMLYVPHALGLDGSPFDVVVLDEAQDTSAAQRSLLLRALAPSARVLAAGDPHQCQPAGTMVRLADAVNEAPIETLRPDDYVCTYNRTGCEFIKKGQVTQTAVHDYRGLLYTISANGQVSRCTDNHRWLVRWANIEQKAWVTYIMRQGSRYRVGHTQMFRPPSLKHGAYIFSLGQRVKAEHADDAWVLRVHSSRGEALAYEQIVSARYGLPQVIFRATWCVTHYTQDLIDHIYDSIEGMEERAIRCLLDHDRRPEYPLYKNGRCGTDTHPRMGRRTVFVTEACNMISGFMAVAAAPAAIKHTHQKVAGFDEARQPRWVTATVKAEPWEGQVYSLGIDHDHTYVADGLVTHNSVYGWLGADLRAFGHLRDALGAEVFPLRVCYRCPRTHLALANAVYHVLDPAPRARLGTVGDLTIEGAVRELRAGDLVLCRNGAPLVSLAYRLLIAGKRARVLGRDLGPALQATITHTVAQPGFSEEDFSLSLGTYAARAQEELEEAGENAAMASAALWDRVQTLRVIWDQHKGLSVASLRSRISDLTSEELPGSAIELASVHRAKGMEAGRVFLLYPELLPHPRAATPMQQEQEQNLRFVALTRGKTALYFVHD